MTKAPSDYDAVVIGAGAAGLICAATAGGPGRRVLVVDHARKPAEKVRISGGGRCNFTNLHTRPENFLSDNPRFCRSALAGFTPADFIARVEARGIAYHEKAQGQLFCDDSAGRIIAMLLDDCREAGVELRLGTGVTAIERSDDGFTLRTGDGGTITCRALVVATGGRSIPKMGATGFGYDVARRFGLDIVPPRPGLVPFVFDGAVGETCKALAGVSVDARVSCGKVRFEDALLFTHRGLSGPAVLQLSSYWHEGEAIVIDLAPGIDAFAELRHRRTSQPKQEMATALADWLPKRLAARIAEDTGCTGRLADLSDKRLRAVADAVNAWRVVPGATEGYRTAEVTVGGVDTRGLSSKTMECRDVPGLYFIGEVVDVTGHLGGFNFQWAWASGVAAGRTLAARAA